jgi:uncharacterized protein
MAIRITAAYGAALAAGFIWLSLRVAWRRWSLETYIGDGDDTLLRRLTRAHANFAENVPLCLVMLGFAEQLGSSQALLHALGALLLGGRVLHAYGVSREPEPIWFRVVGYAATCCALAGASLACADGVMSG